MAWETLGKALERFEREEWGTNDPKEIREAIEAQEWDASQKRMTGMDEEQADWDADE